MALAATHFARLDDPLRRAARTTSWGCALGWQLQNR